MIRRRFSLVVILVAVVTTLIATVVRTSSTEAAWEGREHLAATVTTGYWPTSGSAAAQAGTVTLLRDNIVLIGTGPPRPWLGPTTSSSQTSPGRTLSTSAGPYTAAAVLGLANGATSRGTTGQAIGGRACAVYPWGPPGPTQCEAPSPTVAYASSTLNDYTFQTTLLLGIGQIDMVKVQSPVTAAAICDLSTSAATSTVNAPSLSGPDPLLVRNVSISMPGPNSFTPISIAQGSSVSVTGRLTSVAVAEPGGSARASLTLTLSIKRLSVIGLEILSLDVTIVLVNAVCGPGSTSLTTTAAVADSPAARSVVTPSSEASSTTLPLPPASSTIATTTTTTATTAPSSTSPTASASDSTTTDPTISPTTTTVGAVSTTGTSATTTLPEPTPTTAPTTTDILTRTTAAPPPTTVFSGPVDGTVTRLTTADGDTCTSGDSGAFNCDDGSVLTFDPDALTAPGVAADMLNGVWSPVTTAGGVVTVAAAVRG